MKSVTASQKKRMALVLGQYLGNHIQLQTAYHLAGAIADESEHETGWSDGRRYFEDLLQKERIRQRDARLAGVAR